MDFLIVAFGFMLAMRGTRPVSPKRPAEGLRHILREAADLFLTISLVLASGAVALVFGPTQAFAREYTLLSFGLAVYLLSIYQKKTDVFFLAATAAAFMIFSRQTSLLLGLSLAFVVSAGIAFFQAGFLGLRHQLIFLRVPYAMKGWPVLCLLAALIALAGSFTVFL